VSERVVKVTIAAEVNSYLNGVSQVAKKSREARTEAEALTAKLEAQQRAFNIAGTALFAAGGLVAAGLLLATKRAADFDQAMSEVAATGADAKANISGLREAALEAGAETVYSARQAAGAIEELAKAGIEAKDVIGGGLTGALNLAAAGGIEVADAAETMADTLNQFKLEGRDATHVADLLAAGAGKASGGVDDLGMALKQVGQVAASTGLSVEETTAGLAAFASAGLKGSDAGTSFKTMLGALTPNSQKAADEMKRLGINAFDSQGNFIGLQKFAGQLQRQLAGLSNEQRQASLEIMFGSDAVRAGIELYNQGADGIRKWIKAVDDQGFAAKQASERLDNLNGDLEKMSGAFDSALISIGEAGQGPLRAVVQGITEVIDTFNGMPEGGQVAVYWVGAVASAAAVAGGVFLLAVPKVAAYKIALEELGPAAQTASRGIGNIAKVSTGAVAGFTGGVIAANLLIDALRNTGLHGEELANKIATARNAVQLFDAQSRKTFLGSSNLKIAAAQVDALGGALDKLREKKTGDLIDIQSITAVQGLGAELGKLAQTDLPAAQKQFRLLAEGAGLNKEQQSQLIGIMEPYRDELTKQATASGDAADAATLLKLALGDTPPAVKEASDSIDVMASAASNADDNLSGMKDALSSVNDAAMTMSGAVDAAIGSLNDMAKAAEAEGASVDGSNDASIAFRDSIRDVEQAHKDAAEAILNNGGTLDEAKGKYYEGRDAVIEMLKAKGLDQKAAEDWADKNLGSAKDVEGALRNVATAVDQIPAKKTVTIVTDFGPAYAEMNSFIYNDDGRRITLVVDGVAGRKVAGSSLVDVARAGGGRIPGAPSNTDNMLAAVASGEFITRASVVAKPGVQSHLEYINRTGRIPGYANGGFVHPPRYASNQSINVAAPSLDGMSITGTLDLGNGLTGFVDGRITQASRQGGMKLRNGGRG
jgi:TP901 family phage tail tape measure protein